MIVDGLTSLDIMNYVEYITKHHDCWGTLVTLLLYFLELLLKEFFAVFVYLFYLSPWGKR